MNSSSCQKPICLTRSTDSSSSASARDKAGYQAIRCLSPVSSSEDELILIQCLQKLNTYLRSTKKNLNHILICDIHKNILKGIPNQDISNEFIGLNYARLHVLNNIWVTLMTVLSILGDNHMFIILQ